MKPIYVRGIGLWTTGFASPEAWCRGESDPEAKVPEAKMLEGPLRRRASTLTRISVDVFDQATRDAGFDATAIPTIWATAHGEHATAIKLLKMMLRGEGKVSPTHFHNSVHNTPSGYASISGGNAAPSTTFTGGPELVSSALLEAFCLLNNGVDNGVGSGADTGVDALAVILADEPLHEPFDRSDMQAPLGVALCFSSSPERALLEVCNFRREELEPSDPIERIGGLYVTSALPLLEHVVDRKSGTVGLEIHGHRRENDSRAAPVWCVDVAPVEAP